MLWTRVAYDRVFETQERTFELHKWLRITVSCEKIQGPKAARH